MVLDAAPCRPPVSTPGQEWNPRPQCVVFLGPGRPASQMQSTVNYLWHTDDLLGQGATASVYKARNKVGHSPAQVLGPLSPWWAARVVYGEAEAHSGVREMLRLWDAQALGRGMGSCEGLLGMLRLSGTV